ncbi:BON domain-containing protein [Rhodopseudomonas palustris]|uniref:BON domain-containing protein n=2 Tax=Thiospirillum jenense TaxID=1653858 RepID=A0A839H536_9GAMM|nr:BON domain-containing protein [Rhodopseudomonas palustris]MBB1124764.1 BON domain-containing protein [Thiospirillum jenense]
MATNNHTSTSPNYRAMAVRLMLMGSMVPLLTSCAGPLLVAGAAYGGVVLHERRSAQTVLTDETIEWRARALLLQYPSINDYADINVTSYNRNVLLTGDSQGERARRQFAQLVSRLPQVKQVFNEVRVGTAARSAGRVTEDEYLSSRAKLELAGINLPGFDPLRVKIVAHDATIYLMGVVTDLEAEAVVRKVRRIPGVKHIVRLFQYVNLD